MLWSLLEILGTGKCQSVLGCSFCCHKMSLLKTRAAQFNRCDSSCWTEQSLFTPVVTHPALLGYLCLDSKIRVLLSSQHAAKDSNCARASGSEVTVLREKIVLKKEGPHAEFKPAPLCVFLGASVESKSPPSQGNFVRGARGGGGLPLLPQWFYTQLFPLLHYLSTVGLLIFYIQIPPPF